MRLTHVEVSVPVGTLDPSFEAALDELLRDVFGWQGTTAIVEHPAFGPTKQRVYSMTEHARLLLREAPAAMAGGTEDHLGFAVEAAELERLAARCADLAARDGRVELRYLTGGRPDAVEAGNFTFRTFFVRHLIPLWFQFECIEPNTRREA